jgi:hypothetical protein
MGLSGRAVRDITQATSSKLHGVEIEDSYRIHPVLKEATEMKKLMLVALTVVALMFGVAAYAYADPTVAVTATIPTVFTFSVTNPTVPFGTLTAAELTTGKTVASATDIQVLSNKAYSLSTSMTDFSGSSYTMPASALSYAWTGTTTGSGTGSTSSSTIVTGGARGATHYMMSYTLTPTLNVEPVAYSGTITYTASQP